MNNRKNIDNLLKKADQALQKYKIVNGLVVTDGYDSAIAAFAPTVVINGLLPALAFYCAETKDGKSKIKKSVIIDAIAYTLADKHNFSDYKNLFRSCLHEQNNNQKIEKLTTDIVDAAIALKIMVRTYKIIDNNG